MSQLYKGSGSQINPNTSDDLVSNPTWGTVRNFINNGGSGSGGGGVSPTPSYTKYSPIGDSISDGDSDYPSLLAPMLGVSIDKSSIRPVSGNTLYEHMYKQSKDVDIDSDLITIMLGVNDRAPIQNNTYSLGNITDVNELVYDSSETLEQAIANDSRWDSLLGKFRFCLEYLKNRCPSARIIVITPIYRDFSSSSSTASANQTTLENIRNGEAVVAQRCGVECFYITKEPFYGEYFAPFLSDHIHPTSLGQQLLAKRIYQYIVYGT